MGLFMIYRVIKENSDQNFVYDFDDLEDAKQWIASDLYFDENMETPEVYHYSIIEVEA